MEEINSYAAFAAVLGSLWGIFSYVILRPLNSTIADLNKAIQELRNDLRIGEERRHAMEIKVAEIDQRARAAHHRIDSLEKRVGTNVGHE